MPSGRPETSTEDAFDVSTGMFSGWPASTGSCGAGASSAEVGAGRSFGSFTVMVNVFVVGVPLTAAVTVYTPGVEGAPLR